MNKIDCLLKNYERWVGLPWNQSLASSQRVWFVVYDKDDQRRMRLRVDEFGMATRQAHHGWHLCDLSNAFAEWMAGQEYREAYFVAPDDFDDACSEFLEYCAGKLRADLDSADADSVVAVQGVAYLFDFIRTSDLIKAVDASIKGRLLVFFPGEYDRNTYRLLDARDGWDYLAIPITASDGVYDT